MRSYHANRARAAHEEHEKRAGRVATLQRCTRADGCAGALSSVAAHGIVLAFIQRSH